ncbi:Holliday junction-specific endonuclease [Fructobacillus pseudoficulneus]|uniref:Holliday junction resolvase RecU n=1 Tax=Fructobacillus pseudoficulneus TaxID=220714 RepID=A0A3F3GVA7_9LACO|nr:Holliday junction resolvase RecU [Fructobacillus pseudoficulneus]GAP02272.1 Holliday junction-specific endonuclease [Fructobacillus pseudoficulneus]SEH36251.1 recombination protein U [Fructobacillus pseudoficulneus]
MVNYPKGVHGEAGPIQNQIKTGKTTQKGLLFGRRGMGLESEINEANEYYLANHLAVIYKKPTPVTIVNVDYPARSAAKITEAYFQKPSTTDYNGVYQGRYLDFDAKETKNKTTFPMKNFHEHQVHHLANIVAQGGVGFVLIKFTVLNETYLYPAPELVRDWQRLGGHKSLSYQVIVAEGYPVSPSLTPSLDYLTAVDAYLADLTTGKRIGQPSDDVRRQKGRL